MSAYPVPLYRAIAQTLAWIHNDPPGEWAERAQHKLRILLGKLPHGSGIDHGPTILPDSEPDKLQFDMSFHHMDDSGYYDGWTDHRITIRPSLANEFDISVSGQDRNDVKYHLAEVFDYALSQTIDINSKEYNPWMD
jgi:hypothetical protein